MMGGKSGYRLPFMTGIWLASSLEDMNVKCLFIRLAFAQSSVISCPLFISRGGIPLGP